MILASPMLPIDKSWPNGREPQGAARMSDLPCGLELHGGAAERGGALQFVELRACPRHLLSEWPKHKS